MRGRCRERRSSYILRDSTANLGMRLSSCQPRGTLCICARSRRGLYKTSAKFPQGVLEDPLDPFFARDNLPGEPLIRAEILSLYDYSLTRLCEGISGFLFFLNFFFSFVRNSFLYAAMRVISGKQLKMDTDTPKLRCAHDISWHLSCILSHWNNYLLYTLINVSEKLECFASVWVQM